MEIKKLVINRKRWGTGRLRGSDGKMCCLGFLGRACGIQAKYLTNQPMPSHLSESNRLKFPEFIGRRSYNDSVLARRMAQINDSTHLTNKVKESKLIMLFKRVGIKLTFTDKR